MHRSTILSCLGSHNLHSNKNTELSHAFGVNLSHYVAKLWSQWLFLKLSFLENRTQWAVAFKDQSDGRENYLSLENMELNCYLASETRKNHQKPQVDRTCTPKGSLNSMQREMRNEWAESPNSETLQPVKSSTWPCSPHPTCASWCFGSCISTTLITGRWAEPWHQQLTSAWPVSPDLCLHSYLRLAAPSGSGISPCYCWLSHTLNHNYSMLLFVFGVTWTIISIWTYFVTQRL